MTMIDALRRHLPPDDDLAYVKLLLELAVFAALLVVILTARHPAFAAGAALGVTT